MRDRNLHPILDRVLKRRQDAEIEDVARQYHRVRDAKGVWRLVHGAVDLVRGILFDRVRVNGFLCLEARDSESGEIVDLAWGRNIVTNTGRSALAHLLGNDDLANRVVTQMTFGDTSGTPAVTDNALFGATIITKSVGTGSFPNTSGNDLRVQFSVTISADEGNGAGTQDYNEAALLLGSGDFFSHKATGLIQKDNTVILTANWTIVF